MSGVVVTVFSQVSVFVGKSRTMQFFLLIIATFMAFLYHSPNSISISLLSWVSQRLGLGFGDETVDEASHLLCFELRKSVVAHFECCASWVCETRVVRVFELND